MVTLNHYDYHFVQKVNVDQLSHSFLKHKLLYSFRSTHSHQYYWVWVEVYENNFYAVKFHLKAHRDSKNKYNILTGLNEVRPVINTCIAIMLEIGRENPHSSFGFIGANLENESVVNTKRFRVYRRIMATYFTEDYFDHFFNIKKSSYLLIRKTELIDNPFLIDNLDRHFKELYDFFD